MSAVRAFLVRLGGVFGNRQKDVEFAEEMEFHLQMQIADNLHAGMTPAEARRMALVKSGGMESARDAYRDREGFPIVEALSRDLRYAIRMLRKSPVFTSVVVTTLAVGIGANTALFSLVDAVLLRPLPYPNADKVVVLEDGRQGMLVSYPDYLDWKRRALALSDLAICTRDSPVTIIGPDAPDRVDAAQTSPNLFAVLGVAPLVGRSFSAEDEQQERPVAVISYNLWQSRFNGAPDVLSRALILDGQTVKVIGVMPRTFQFPSGLIQLWRPAGRRMRLSRTRPFGLVIGELRSDATPADAQNELSGTGAHLVPLQQHIAGEPVRVALWSLFGAVSFVLLIGCTNVSNLLLARGTVRQHELAIRAALGASRRRLIAQLMVENAMLCSVAGVGGILLAVVTLGALVEFAPAGTPRLEEVTIDSRVLGFTMIVSCLCTLLFGLLPALQITRCDPQETLKAGGCNFPRGLKGSRAQGTLMVGEFAMALVLLCGAGLMLRSFQFLHQVPLGFEPRNVLTFRVVLPYDWDAARQTGFYARALSRLKNLPTVTAAGAVSNFSLAFNRGTSILPCGASVMDDSVSADFFPTLGVSLQRGRFFTVRDDDATPPVAMVNEALAARCWPRGDAVGKRFRFADGRFGGTWVTVVGVAGDMRRGSMEQGGLAQAFLPLAQSASRGMDFVVRTSSAPGALESKVRHEIASLDSRVPVYHIASLEQRLAATVVPRRFETGLLSLFAAVALFLAAVGIYGVMHYSVAQRTHEIGIRMAGGATPAAVLSMVLRQGLRLASIGLLAGVAGAFLLNRVFSSLPLFGVTPTDPLTFALVAGLLGAVAALACCVPAWRAATVDPVLALRHE